MPRSLTPIGMGLAFCYAAAFGGVWIAGAPRPVLLLALVLAAACLWLSLVDIATLTIPDAATLIIAATGLMGQLLFAPDARMVALTVIGAAIVTALFWGIGAWHYHRRGVEGLGIGDAKLMGAAVLCVGIGAIWWVVLAAALGGIAWVLIDRARGGRIAAVPFGPFLAYAVFIVYSFQASGA